MKSTLHILFAVIVTTLCVLYSSPGETREATFKLSPGLAVFEGLRQNTVAPGVNQWIRKYSFIVDAEFAIETFEHWYPLIDIDYSRTMWRLRDATGEDEGSIDMLGFYCGLKYVIHEHDMPNLTDDFIDHSRYWFGAGVGPAYSRVRSSVASYSASGTAWDLGLMAGGGFEYFFSRVFGVGVQVKMNYVNYKDNYFVIFGGPTLSGRFK